MGNNEKPSFERRRASCCTGGYGGYDVMYSGELTFRLRWERTRLST